MNQTKEQIRDEVAKELGHETFISLLETFEVMLKQSMGRTNFFTHMDMVIQKFVQKELATERYAKQAPPTAISAEEFIREKIREKQGIKGQMYALWKYQVSGEDCLRWANEFFCLNSQGKQEYVYPKLCPKCNGDGKLPNTGVGTTAHVICDICSGGKMLYPVRPEFLPSTLHPTYVSDEEAGKMLERLSSIFRIDSTFETKSTEQTFQLGFVHCLDWMRSLIFKEGKGV